MAIVSDDIHNQSFSIDRKGYDVDEVDVFLEHVANEIDALNALVENLENKVEVRKFGGYDTLAVPVPPPMIDGGLLAEKDEVILDLQCQLDAKKAEDNVIAQTLIIAQRSADEVVAGANAEAKKIIHQAEEEARRVVGKAETDRQRIIDSIKKLEDDREDSREAYQELLHDYIRDAQRKLDEIGLPVSSSAHARVKPESESAPVSLGGAPRQLSTNSSIDGAGAYPSSPVTVAVAAAPVVAAVTPRPTQVEKDFSGFGDTDDSFAFDELD